MTKAILTLGQAGKSATESKTILGWQVLIIGLGRLNQLVLSSVKNRNRDENMCIATLGSVKNGTKD